jgi:hypothetical protein
MWIRNNWMRWKKVGDDELVELENIAEYKRKKLVTLDL